MLQNGSGSMQADQLDQDLSKSAFLEIQHTGGMPNVVSSSPYHIRPTSTYHPHHPPPPPTHHHPHQHLSQMDMGFGPNAPVSRTPTLGYQFQMAPPPSGYNSCVPAHLFAMNGYQGSNPLHHTRDSKYRLLFISLPYHACRLTSPPMPCIYNVFA